VRFIKAVHSLSAPLIEGKKDQREETLESWVVVHSMIGVQPFSQALDIIQTRVDTFRTRKLVPAEQLSSFRRDLNILQSSWTHFCLVTDEDLVGKCPNGQALLSRLAYLNDAQTKSSDVLTEFRSTPTHVD
jgi:hypothetical protein